MVSAHFWWTDLKHGVVVFLGFGWRYVADGLQEPSVVEPIDPFEGSELDGLEEDRLIG